LRKIIALPNQSLTTINPQSYPQASRFITGHYPSKIMDIFLQKKQKMIPSLSAGTDFYRSKMTKSIR